MVTNKGRKCSQSHNRVYNNYIVHLHHELRCYYQQQQRTALDSLLSWHDQPANVAQILRQRDHETPTTIHIRCTLRCQKWWREDLVRTPTTQSTRICRLHKKWWGEVAYTHTCNKTCLVRISTTIPTKNARIHRLHKNDDEKCQTSLVMTQMKWGYMYMYVGKQQKQLFSK